MPLSPWLVNIIIREWNFKTVKTGDSVDIGNGKSLVFVEMRMLHWPDSMATYMTGDNILFSKRCVRSTLRGRRNYGPIRLINVVLWADGDEILR